MLLVRDLVGQIAMANESYLLSDVDWFAVQELIECLIPVYDTTTASQSKNVTAGEFLREWPKCKVQLQFKNVNNTSSLPLAMLHAVERRKTTFLYKAAFLAAVYVNSRNQVLYF